MHLKIESNEFLIAHETSCSDDAIKVAMIVREYLSYDKTFFLANDWNIDKMFCFGSVEGNLFTYSPICSDLQELLRTQLKSFSSFESAIKNSSEKHIVLEVNEELHIPFSDIYSLLRVIVSANNFFNTICDEVALDENKPNEFNLNGMYNNFSINHLRKGEMMPWFDLIPTENDMSSMVSDKCLVLTPLSSDLSPSSILEKANTIGTLFKDRINNLVSTNPQEDYFKIANLKLAQENSIYSYVSVASNISYFNNEIEKSVIDILSSTPGVMDYKIYGSTIIEHMTYISLSNSFIGRVANTCPHTIESVNNIMLKQSKQLAKENLSLFVNAYFKENTYTGTIEVSDYLDDDFFETNLKTLLNKIYARRLTEINSLSIEKEAFDGIFLPQLIND